MSDDKNLKDEELDKVSGGLGITSNPGGLHPRPVSATGEGEIEPDLRIGGGGHVGTGNPHGPQ
jgi:hypothetical protein